MRAGKILAVIGDQPLERQIDFADQNPVVEFIDHPAHFRDHVLHLRLIRGVARQQAFVRRPMGAKTGIGRVVAKLLVLDQVPDHVDAKAVNALAEPEAHDIVDRRAHLWVAPVEVGLLRQEGMIIILLRVRVILPRAAAEFRHPVIRRAAVGPRIAPQIPVALRIIPRTPAFDEPRMPVGGMIGHQIEDQLQAGAMDRRHQRIEIRHRAEQRIDAAVIRNVVAKVGHRRGKDRRQPDRIDSKRAQIRQPFDDPADIADAVAVGILIGAWIDLIKDAVSPPDVSAHFENRPLS